MFTVESVTNLSWSNPEHTQFDCVAKFAEFDEPMPFGCNASDTYAHSQEIWGRALAGEFGAIAEYVEPTLDTNQPQPEVSGAQTL